MMILEIAVELPSWVAEKLASGEYERTGSVIYEAASKQVVKWLRDTEGQQTAQSALLSGLSGAGPALAALQVVNMAVSIAGFALLAGKISAVSRQCDAIFDRLGSANQHLQWLRDAQLAGYQARLCAALESAQTAHQIGESVLPYDTQINECALFFRKMLTDMLRKGNAFRDADMFQALLVQHTIAVVGRARSQWLVAGPASGLAALEQGQRAHAELVGDFQATLRDPQRSVAALLDLAPEQRVLLKDAGATLRHVSRQLDEKRAEMADYAQIQLKAPAGVENLKRLEAHPQAWLLLLPADASLRAEML